MKKRFYLLIVIVMLLSLLPLTASEAKSVPFVRVGSWNISDEIQPYVLIKFAAYDIDWKISKAAKLEFGFLYNNGFLTTETIDVSLTLNPKDYKYPQDLNLAAKKYRELEPNPHCALTQFVRILDAQGLVLAEAENGPYDYCITWEQP